MAENPDMDEIAASPPLSAVEMKAIRNRMLADIARVGSGFAATVMTFCGIGWYMDHLLGTQPWGVIGMTFLGATGAFIGIVRLAGGFDQSADKTPKSGNE